MPRKGEFKYTDGRSRQLHWQENRIQAGLCSRCGLRPLVNATNCEVCIPIVRKLNREAQYKRTGGQPWKPGKPGRPPKKDAKS